MTKDLTVGEPARLILLFTLPLIAGNMIQQLYAFVDTLLVGRFLGVEALAAVGCTGCLMFLMLGFVMGFTSGLTIITGQHFGARDYHGVRRSVACCMYLSLGLSVIMTIFGVSLCRYFLIWMQTPAEILDGAYAFISIVYGGITLFVFYQTQINLIRALGDSRTPTVLLAIGLFINIILEPIAIIVLDLGIPGAAFATLVSQVFGNGLTAAYIWCKVPRLHTSPADWHVTRAELWEHVSIALPMGFQSSIIAIGSIVLQVALNQLGPIAVASYSASQKIESLAMMPMMSFGLAMATYSAQNFGARKFARIEEGVKKSLYMSVSFAIVAGIALIICGPFFMHLFVGDGEQQVIDYGQEYLITNGSCYWILAVLFIVRSTLQGLGLSLVPTIAGVMELIMRCLAALVLCSFLGYLGACLANPMAWIGSCIPLLIAFHYERQKFRQQYRMGA